MTLHHKPMMIRGDEFLTLRSRKYGVVVNNGTEADGWINVIIKAM